MKGQIKKIVMLSMTVGLVCCLGACSEKSEQDKANEIFSDIVLNDGSFIDMNNEGTITKISDYSTDDEEAEVRGYSYLDLDEDGLKELMVYLNINNGTFKIFRYKEGHVYGYEWAYAAARSMGETGVMFDAQVTGAIEYYTLSFTDEGVQRKVICGINIESSREKYYIEDKEVDRDTYKAYSTERYKGNAKIYNDINELNNVLSQ